MNDRLLYQLHIRLNANDIAMRVMPDVPRVGDILYIPMKNKKDWFEVTQIIWFFDEFNDPNRIRVKVQVKAAL